MDRILFVSNILDHINSFHVPYITMLRQLGYSVDVMTNANGVEKPEYCDRLYDICIERSPFRTRNIKALAEAKNIIGKNKYCAIHVHTPMGGVIGRLAAKEARRNGAKVIYTSHGFHFYNGAPIINWLLYYPMEKYLARYTDCIITINSEDFERAKRFAPMSCHVIMMNGVGVDRSKFSFTEEMQQTIVKKKFGLEGKTVIFYAAEFIKRKNHRFLIENFKNIVDKVPNAVLLLAGRGPLLDKMKTVAMKCKLEDSIQFLGYRNDISEILQMVDINVSTSFQEGLPINVVEGIATGCPEVVSDIRGSRDVVRDGWNGFIYRSQNSKEFCQKIIEILNNRSLRQQMREANKQEIERLDINVLVSQMQEIYRKTIGDSFYEKSV